jgi:serine/threonine protein kinase
MHLNLRQLLSALEFLHSFDLIHTDLKVENILFADPELECDSRGDPLPRSSKIKLIDFGGATYNDEHKTRVICTRQYRGPEVRLMYMYMCMCMYIYMCICVYVYIIYVYMYAYVYICICMHIYMCIYVHVYACLLTAVVALTLRSRVVTGDSGGGVVLPGGRLERGLYRVRDIFGGALFRHGIYII